MEIAPIINNIRSSTDNKTFKEREGPRHVRLSRSLKDRALVLFGDDLTIFNATHFFKSIGANVKLRGGKWYYEVTLHTEHLFQIGWSQHFDFLHLSNGSGTGDDKQSYGYDGKRCLAWNDFCVNFGVGWHVGDVIGCYIDLTDLTQTRIGYTQNGVDLGVAFTSNIDPEIGISPSISCDWLQSATVNFGQTPFKFAPPAGHIGLEIDVDVDYYIKNYWLQAELDRPLIFWAIEKNQVDNVRTLLSTMDRDELSTVTDQGTTLLTAAIVRDAHEIVALLLNAGARIAGKMLHQACQFDAVNSLKLLVAKGGDIDALSEHKMTPLHYALRAGAARCFAYLHKECRAQFVQHSHSLENALHFAVVGRDLHAIQVIAELCPHFIEGQDKEEKTPLFYAVGADNFAAIELLVTRFGAKMNTLHSWHGSLFSEAAVGHYLALQKLVQLGCTPSDPYTDTAIARASKLGYYDCLDFLLKNREQLHLDCNPEQLGKVIFIALKNKYNKCLEVLLDNGAATELNGEHILFRTLGSPVCTKTVLGRVPLTKIPEVTSEKLNVVVDGHVTSLIWNITLPDQFVFRQQFRSETQKFAGVEWQVMIAQGLDAQSLGVYLGCDTTAPLTAEVTIALCHPIDRTTVSKTDTLSYDDEGWLGWTEFTRNAAAVVHHKQLQVQVDLFVVKGTTEEDSALDTEQITPLHAASEYNATGVMELLLSNDMLRTAVNKPDSQGNTPLHWAALHGAEHCMTALLAHGATPNMLNALKFSPLHYATVKGHTKCVELLLQHGADPNCRTPAGATALLLSLKSPRQVTDPKLVLLLLEQAETDLTVVDQENKNVLTLIDRVQEPKTSKLDVFNTPENRNRFNNKELSNVTFVVENKEIYAVRELVDQHCDYFNAMFGSNMKEATQNSIPIQNFTYDLMYLFLEFLHVGKALDISSRNLDEISKLLEVAEVFFSDSFSDFIELELTNRLSLDSISEIYNLAVENSLVHVLHQCFHFLQKHAEVAVKNSETMAVARHYLSARLRGDF